MSDTPQLNDNVEIINIEDEMRQSYTDYAMSVIIGRALPDVRDGLKPVQRRVLYGMLDIGLLSTKKTSKCAGVVGHVMGQFHPHGDSAIYDALVRMAQPWNLRYMLVDGQGNFGSMDGDPAAAFRYTECRLTALAESLLRDIEQDTVDFAPNFDESKVEPKVLPALWPNLLVNGADGIAVGMATHMPPHNLGEVIDAALALLEDPAITIEAIMKLVPGPDFPTGGVISGRGAIRQAYHTGKGIIQLSAKCHFETIKRKARELEAIVVTEIPYQVNKARLIEKIADLVNEKLIEGISNIREESDREGLRVVIELKREATAEVVLNQLYKLTPLRSSFGIINLAIVDGRPLVCTIKQLLECFIEHRRDVVTRRSSFQLRKCQDRMHILEGFRIALLNLDDVIQLIKKSDDPSEARAKLCSTYELTEIQSQAILDLRLQKLTGMERLAIEREHEELANEIRRLMDLLSDSKKMDALIGTELTEVKEKFADPRRTVIEDSVANDITVEDLIEKEEMVVTVSHNGYAKRTTLSSYKAQKRGGKGISGTAQTDDDFTEHLFVASTHDYLLIFTDHGRLYCIKVYEIPEAGRVAKGRALVNLLDIKDGEKVTAVLPISKFEEGRTVVMASRNGYIKKTELLEFSNPRRGGIIACSLDENDVLIGVGITPGNSDILLSTATGIAIRFSEADVRSMGRNARGVTGIKLDTDDVVVGMAIVDQSGGEVAPGQIVATNFLTVTQNGFGKRTEIGEYRMQGRAGKGIIDIKTGERNGKVVGVCPVNDQSELILMTSAGKIIRFRATDVSVVGRNTMGVRLVNLDPGEIVVAISLVVENESETESE
jgi:DNA gyrase subunit A